LAQKQLKAIKTLQQTEVYKFKLLIINTLNNFIFCI